MYGSEKTDIVVQEKPDGSSCQAFVGRNITPGDRSERVGAKL